MRRATALIPADAILAEDPPTGRANVELACTPDDGDAAEMLRVYANPATAT